MIVGSAAADSPCCWPGRPKLVSIGGCGQSWRQIPTSKEPAPATGPDDPWQQLLSARSNKTTGDSNSAETGANQSQTATNEQTAPSQPQAAWAGLPRESWRRRPTQQYTAATSPASQSPRTRPAATIRQRSSCHRRCLDRATNPTALDQPLNSNPEAGPLADLGPVLNRALATDSSLLSDTHTDSPKRHGNETSIELLLAHIGGRHQVAANRGLMTLAERDDHADLTTDPDLRTALVWPSAAVTAHHS